MQETDLANLLHPSRVSRLHWRAQATVHFLLSLPITILTSYSWGISVSAVFKICAAYLFLYLFIYVPLYYLLPFITLHPVQREIEKLRTGATLDDNELVKLISYLINFPLPGSLATGLVEMTAFILGAVFWQAGIVPELLPILHIALLETVFLGIVVVINITFLNIVNLDDYMRNVVERIITDYPRVLYLQLPVKHISMYTKVFFLILLTTLAGEISILIFFMTYILSTNPGQLLDNAVIIFSVMAINIIYIFVLAPIVSKNFTTPIKKLVSWTKDVSTGNLASRIGFLTNDETAKIIRSSNTMIDRLDKTTTTLRTSMEVLENDRKLIESERKKLSTVLSGVIDGVIALDMNKRVILMNKAGEVITGFLESEAKGMHIDDVLHMMLNDGTELKAHMYFPQIPDQKTVSLPDLKLAARAGKVKYISLSCSVLGENTDTDSAYLIMFHDTTTERELAEMKLDFVSMAAHELRTPITIIRGYLDVFLLENKSKLDAEQNEMIDRVTYAATELSTLVESLLVVAKIERGGDAA